MLFLIVTIIIIWLFFLKNKIFIHFFIISFLFVTLINSLWEFINLLHIGKSSEYTELAKFIIRSDENNLIIDNKVKTNFIDFSEKVNEDSQYKYQLRDNFYVEKAKRILWMYDFEYCKIHRTNKCFLEFIKWKEWLNWYKNFIEKYNFFINEYWQYIKKETILEGLKKDLREDKADALSKAKIIMYDKFKLEHNFRIKNKKLSSYNYFLANDRKNITKKERLLIKR